MTHFLSWQIGRRGPCFKFADQETWTHSNVRHGRDPNFLYGLHERTFAHYEMCEENQKRYLSGLPETTEYQDRYLGHLPTEKRKKLYLRDCLH